MDGARYERIQSLFHHAADLPPSDQRAFLESACAGDDELLQHVLAMLLEDARHSSLLDVSLAHVADRLLDRTAAKPAPAQIGPYTIREFLGEGGMGVVYRAERQELGSVVAVKVLRDAWLSPARRERFAAEQRTLAQLNHPFIARLYDADELTDGTPWFVMEYVEGVPLTDYCKTRALSIAERLQLFRDVCEAVQHAHRQLVIHRDLKPSNILVTAEGSVKLLDFGIAKQLETLERAPDLTRTGLRLMTPAYAAPEQVRGGETGIGTDIYSLGVILYELLAEQLPFDLSTRAPAEAEALILEADPVPPSVIAKRIHEAAASHATRFPSRQEWADLDVLSLTAMHKDSSRRYRTVEALIRDLDHFLEGEPLEAHADTLQYRFAKFVRRNRRLLAAATVVLATTVGLVIFYTVRLTAARNAALAQAARTERIQQFMLNLFEGGDRQAGPADDLRVVTLLDRGVKEARALASDRSVQAELYGTLGTIYQKLGNFTQADSLLRSALDQRRSLFGSEHPDVAESLVSLGLLRTDQAQYDEAERIVRDGLAQARRSLPPNHPAVAVATAALGKVLEDRGAYDKAIPVLEEAVRLQSAAGPPTADLATSLYELANTHFYAGHYDLCESFNRRALAIHRQLYGDRHPLVSDDLINLGAIQYELGHYADAEQYYREGLDITQAWYGKDHFKTAANLVMLGRALNKENRSDEAVDILRQALAIRERVYGEMHPSVASTVNELGTIALIQGKFDDAAAYFTRMAEIYRTVYGEKPHYLIGTAVSNLGSVYLARNEPVRAEPLFREAIGIYRQTLSAEHLNTGIARVKLGRALLRQRRYEEAEVESRAGYEILRKQMNPTVSWLQNAREDLAAEYEALKDTENASRFRSELTATR
jgi:serine/threonine protein kinase